MLLMKYFLDYMMTKLYDSNIICYLLLLCQYYNISALFIEMDR